MDGLAGLGVALYVSLLILSLVVGILWICMPFAIFGTKPILRELLAEQRKTNKLLSEAAERARGRQTFASDPILDGTPHT
ncbi:hypothetical protein QTI24_14715 [Variovorax sp. J22P240]|uniref:hypothetical protein n=1 Tax=Variovorax sp. J22P240 TaxID=3053514 RepID=UPI00257673AF|nr:hypothetical protein [Variovorax sp. J22P240]MDL9999867.1 hypothetical protein [Variovorax sp. J22P240]